MRFLFCKNRCPSICFCHPSSHIFTPPQPSPSPSPSPSQLEGGKPSSIPCQSSDRVILKDPDLSSIPAFKEVDQIPQRVEPQQTLESDKKQTAHVNENRSNINGVDENDNQQQHCESNTEDVNTNGNGNGNAIVLKGSLHKTCSDSVLVEKKKVQWLDHAGKELTQIREFDHSEDLDYGGMNRRGCECTIL